MTVTGVSWLGQCCRVAHKPPVIQWCNFDAESDQYATNDAVRRKRCVTTKRTRKHRKSSLSTFLSGWDKGVSEKVRRVTDVALSWQVWFSTKERFRNDIDNSDYFCNGVSPCNACIALDWASETAGSPLKLGFERWRWQVAYALTRIETGNFD